jgi:colanic acid/amylovoran biosynthesis glycosyltransferase
VRRRGRRLHLLEVGVRWPPESFICWKLEGLAARGMRVTVASPRIFDPAARLNGVELLGIPSPPPSRAAAWRVVLRSGLALLVRSPRRIARLVRGIRRQMSRPASIRYGGAIGYLAECLPLARLRPDVVHFEWHRTAVSYLPLFDVWGCPVTTSCRGSDISVYPYVPGADLYAKRLPEVLRRASAVHCSSDSLKREAVAFGLDPARAWVARAAVDPDLFRPSPGNGRPTSGPDNRALRVITLGWLRWEKGLEYGLQAIRSLLDRGAPVQLEMVGAVPDEHRGEMDQRERILHAIADLGLEQNVRLRGIASSAEVSRRLCASDVLLHPSVTEGAPTALVEAMACEVPVVATDCGGVGEAVTDGVEGYLVAPRDPEQLASALWRLWRDPALRARMGRAGRARVLAEFTLEQEHGVIHAMYRAVTGSSQC